LAAPKPATVHTLPTAINSPRGYFIKYTPNPGFSGPAAERIVIEVSDTNTIPHVIQFSAIFLYIDILPVNDPPTLFYKQNSNTLSTSAPTITVAQPVTTGAVINLASHITDSDADTTSPTFILSVTKSGGGSLSAIVAGQTVDAKGLNVQGTLDETNAILASIQYTSSSVTNSVVSISVNDRGSTGTCATGFENLRKPDGSCPRETRVVFMINVSSQSMSLMSSIGASTGIGGAFVLAAALSVYAARKLKSKNKDSWKEFDEENFADFAQSNPIFADEMSRGSNPLYHSSLEDSD